MCYVLAACGSPSAPPAPPLYVVVLIDWSGSGQPAARLTFADIAGQIESLVEPGFAGAEIHFRLITQASWQPGAAIGTVEIPAIAYPPKPVSACNPADPELCAQLEGERQEEIEAHMLRLATERERVSRELVGIMDIALDPTDGTDLEGALAAAETMLTDAPENARRMLVVASDLRHCLQNDCALRALAPVEFAGVRVVVAGFGDSGAGDVPVALVRDAFEWWVAASGSSAEFLLPGQKVDFSVPRADELLKEEN